MIERAVVVGQSNPMIGILSEPARVPETPERPAVILLNAGLLHRVGPNRTYVDIARSLAADGFLTLRIDLCGLGDSEARRDSASFEEAAVDDTRRAMDYLREKRGARSFILGGLCSGADNTFRVALVDSRVRGAILLDWYAYRTPLFYVRHYGPRLFQPRAWRSTFVNMVQRVSEGSVFRNAAQAQLIAFGRVFPPKAEIVPQLREILRRDIQLLCVYTGGQVEAYNYRKQFEHMFGSLNFKGQVRTEFLHTSDHTFTLRRHQVQLRDTITSWARSVDWARVAGRSGESDGFDVIDAELPAGLAPVGPSRPQDGRGQNV